MTGSARLSTTAFIRLDSRVGWRMSALSERVLADPRLQVVRLGSEGDDLIPPNEPFGSFGSMTLPTGVAISSRGEVFLADPGGRQILYYTNEFGAAARPPDAPDHWPFRPLWQPEPAAPTGHAGSCRSDAQPASPTGPYQLDAPRDLALSPGGDLVIVDGGNGRLLVYTWPELRVRHLWTIPGGEPRALAFDSRGFAYVADAGNGRIWRLDTLWQVDPTYVGGQAQLAAPGHLALDDQDRVWVLDEGQQRVFRLNGKGRLSTDAAGSPVSADPLDLLDSRFPPPLTLMDDELQRPQSDRPRCPPLRLPGIQVDRLGRLDRTQLPLLALPRRISLPRSGRFISHALDSEIPSCQWHRLVLGTDLPETGRLLVQTFSHETPLEESRIAELDDRDWSTHLTLAANDLPEVLVQSPPGRYLWLRIEFLGDGQTTPRLHHLEVLAPRRSALRWLPPPYHQDPESARFLDRYLSYFDTLYAEIEQQIRDFTGYLDPYGVPTGDFLDWLGSWFDWQFLADWPTAVRREMIAEAIGFFSERGTLNGLRRLLQWHTGLSGDQPQIIEHFRLRDYEVRRQVAVTDLSGGRLYIGERPLAPETGELAHRFTVVIPSSALSGGDDLSTLNRLIEAQKPAHTAFQLRVIRPGIRIGCQSSVGIDTWLSDYPSEPLGRVTLGRAGRLAGSVPRGLRIGNSVLFQRAKGQRP